jgi:hypothetical protein
MYSYRISSLGSFVRLAAATRALGHTKDPRPSIALPPRRPASLRLGRLHRSWRGRRRLDTKFRVGRQHLRAGGSGRFARCCRSRHVGRLDFRAAPTVVNEPRQDGRADDRHDACNPRGMPSTEAPKSGYAPSRVATFRRRGATRKDASSTATTRASAKYVKARSTNMSSPSPTRCPRSARKSKSIWACADCRAKRCWRP